MDTSLSVRVWEGRKCLLGCLIENKDVQCITLHFNSTSYLQSVLSCFLSDRIQQPNERDGDVCTMRAKLRHIQADLL